MLEEEQGAARGGRAHRRATRSCMHVARAAFVAGVPKPPPKIDATGSISKARFRDTLEALRQSHSNMVSQAQLLK